MSKKPRGLGPSCLVSHSVPDDDDDNSAPRPQRPRRASPQSSRTPIPSPSTGLLALLASFATPTIIPAHAAPAPVSPNALRTHPSPDAIPTPIYLDFLYPHSPLPQQQHPYNPSHAPEEPTDPPRRLKKPRSSVSTAGDCACVIPTKFEENDTGWMVAERWTLHGKTHPNAFAGYIPVSIRPQMDSVDHSLDLPTGWNSTASSRNARYDPIIVTVFAIILACGITGAIAASVWRNQQIHTRRLKMDLERATKPKRRRTTDEVDSVDSDASGDENKPREQTKKKRRRRKAAGSGGGAVAPGAGKSSTTFWRPSPRFVGRLRFRSRRHKPAEVPTNEPSIVPSPPASSQLDLSPREDPPNPPTILVTAEEDSASHVQSRHPSHIDIPLSSAIIEDPNNSETKPEPERIPATVLPLPVSPIQSSHSLDQDPSIHDFRDDSALLCAATVSGYTSNPPAYLRTGRSWTSGHTRHIEKAPLPGLEAEYDERDLERWRASMLAAGSTSSGPRPRSATRSELNIQPPPPSLNRGHGVHIATDDKAALARLHSLADQPDAPLPPAEAPPISGTPTVPTFGVVDDWYTETQLEQVSSLDQPSSHVSPAPVVSRLPFPPPPESYLLSRYHGSLSHDRSYHDTQDMNEAYTLRQVWGRTTPSIGPSAPPDEMEEDGSRRRVESMEGLVPSAPPLLGDPISSAQIPSAPALWDEENDTHDPVRGSAPPLEASGESPLGDEQPELTSDRSRGFADAHPDVRVQWVQQRQVEMEGVGLPKYEP